MTHHDGTQTSKRRRGGQELPDAVQDRPEQNAGYDAAAGGAGTGTRAEPLDEAEVIALETDARDAELRLEEGLDEDDRLEAGLAEDAEGDDEPGGR